MAGGLKRGLLVDAGRRAGHLGWGGGGVWRRGLVGVRRCGIPPSRMPDPRWKLQCAINHRRVFTVGAPAEAARPGCLWGVREIYFASDTFDRPLTSSLTTFGKKLCSVSFYNSQ